MSVLLILFSLLCSSVVCWYRRAQSGKNRPFVLRCSLILSCFPTGRGQLPAVRARLDRQNGGLDD